MNVDYTYLTGENMLVDRCTLSSRNDTALPVNMNTHCFWLRLDWHERAQAGKDGTWKTSQTSEFIAIRNTKLICMFSFPLLARQFAKILCEFQKNPCVPNKRPTMQESASRKHLLDDQQGTKLRAFSCKPEPQIQHIEYK